MHPRKVPQRGTFPAGQTAAALYTHEHLVGYSFRYDVLNRLRTSSFSYYSQGSTSAWNSMGSADYYMSLAYDPNGNIDSMTRHGYAKPGGSVAMDKLTYSYPTTPGSENNRLRHVKDSESSGSYANDIDDEPDDNYLYDPSGNLIYDQSDGTLIRWNAQGKVIQVRKITATVKKDLIYIYDAAGERIAKKELDYLASGDSSWVTYYVRDAGEKVIAVYRQKLHYSDTSDTCPPGVPGSGMDTDADGIDETPPNFCDNCNSTITPTLPPEFTYRNPWQEDYDGDGIGDACDPCPFGPGDECGTPLSDTAVVRASKWIPTGFAVLAEWHIYGSSVQGRVGIWKPEKNRDTTIVADTIFTRILTLKEYELKDHLGNVTVVISDLKTASTGGSAPYPFGVDVKSFSHYYPFGMLQPGAFGSNREYRFGYNGKESDNSWKGEGNVYDYGFRVYDPRIAKFLSVDPLAPEYPWYTPYQFAGNMPIQAIDLDGAEELKVNVLSHPTQDHPGRVVIKIVLEYRVITSGVGAVHRPDLIVGVGIDKNGIDAFTRQYSQGNTEMDLVILPSQEIVERSFWSKIFGWISNDNDYYEATVEYVYTVSAGKDLATESVWVAGDRAGRGLVMEPILTAAGQNGQITMDMTEIEALAVGFLNNASAYKNGPGATASVEGVNLSTADNFIALNPYYFDIVPNTKFDFNKSEMTPIDILIHETGHNAAEKHEHGREEREYEYDQRGLQSNSRNVHPSDANTLTIINDKTNRNNSKYGP